MENEGSVAVVDSQQSVAIGKTKRVFEEVLVDRDVINIDSSSYPNIS